MKKLSLVLLLSSTALPQTTSSTEPAKTLAFVHGNWFDGHSFKPRTAYASAGSLTFHRPSHVDEVLDLAGGFVVPPFGEAHNHNVEPPKIDAVIRRYLEHGIFYVKDPDNLPAGRAKVAPKLNQPESIDVMFSNGGFTGKDGHPTELVKRNIDRGIWTGADGEGAFYYSVSSEAEIDQEWPQFLSTEPDFAKTFLLFSEDYGKRKDDPRYSGWKGLDPDLLKGIVRRAHSAGLRVSTHIESAADFHNALLAGVDEINHMPGFRITGDVETHKITDFQIAEDDANLAARRGIFVVTTLAGSSQPPPAGGKREFDERDELNRRNLELLKKYRVKLAFGSDSYRGDTVPEALYIASLGVFDNRELLRIWCDQTARTIFPRRKVGKLKEGYEASFLVLKENPLRDFAAIQEISLRVKQGRVLHVSSEQR